jgi:prevent-host-death family protein
MKSKKYAPRTRRETRWKLEEAKARFSEVVRRAQHEPQHVTVRGREAVVVLSADSFARLAPENRESLVELLQGSPLSDVTFGHKGELMPVRDVAL